jgi:hypothetical protein
LARKAAWNFPGRGGVIVFRDEPVLLPEGTVAVERGRLERLTEYVAADLACTAWPDEDDTNPFWDRYMAARGSLRAGDTDAVPEPVGTEGGGS